MCGVAGIWRPGRGGDRLAHEVDAMAAVLAHRGPDASGTWVDEDRGLALGHRRLAVVGLGPAGAQPMASRSGRWILTYNGELYGADRVRARLESRGLGLRGTSDTEVLVEALDAWGPRAALEAIDGMFAFGAWDREQGRLVLARDRMGEKPLVYAPLGDGGMAFASELGALRVLDDLDASLDPEAVALYLRFGYVPAPWTIHRGARKLPPGCWLETSLDGRPGPPRRYWSHAEVLSAGRADTLPDTVDTLDALDEAVGRAVRRQLHAEVGVGAFLSGGIDSSLVATVAAEHSARPLRTFTIGSPDPDLDESAPARAVAERLGAAHTELVVTPADALAEVPALSSRWDEPFGDSSQLPTLLVARLARRSVTVALSGDGGDELFGGYNRHRWLPAVWSRVGAVPLRVRRAGAAALALPPPGAWERAARLVPRGRRPRLPADKGHKLGLVVGAADEAEAYARLCSHWQDPGPLVGVAEPPTMIHDRGRWAGGPDLGEQLMGVDTVTYLPDDVLVKVDRATMAVGLEARVPLLDREVVELAARLPPSLKVRRGEGKWALRELLARRHPRTLFERPKSGFGIPVDAWLRGELRPWAEDLLAPAALASGPIAHPAPVRAAWREHLSGRRDRSVELWDVLMLQGWLRSIGR